MGDVIDLAERMRERKGDERPKLYIDHKAGKITGSPSGDPPLPEFGDRLQRIRASLEKINRLMSELKKMSQDNDGR